MSDNQLPNHDNNAPNEDFGLSDREREAAYLQVTGQYKKKEIADELGADESTLWRWRQKPNYQAFLAHLREDRHRQLDDRLRSLGARAAVELVILKINEGDKEAALRLLEGLGHLGGSRPRYGPTDPEERRRRQELDNLLDLITQLAQAELVEGAVDTLADELQDALPTNGRSQPE